ncbi:nitroreductase [Streptomyces pratensis]|uniref:nitroreductase n=1 Tax=Streptomyces pratensis TaxID=1169025 RepID=UPI003019229C
MPHTPARPAVPAPATRAAPTAGPPADPPATSPPRRGSAPAAASHPPPPTAPTDVPPGFLRRALADARSPRVPALNPYAPERPFPWPGRGLPLTGPGAAVDLDRGLRLSLAAPAGTPGRLRPAPSAGALHPVRAHLLVGAGCSLPPGRYAYDPRAHRAHPRGPAPADAPPGAIAVLTLAAARTVAHYGHRAWPLLLLDAGHAAAAVALAAGPAGAQVSLDADGVLLSAAAGLPRAAEGDGAWAHVEPELPVAAVWLAPRGEDGEAARVLGAWAASPRATAPLPRPGAERAPLRELTETWCLLAHLTAAPARPEGAWHQVRLPEAVTDDALSRRRSAAPGDLVVPPGEEALARILATAWAALPDGPPWAAAVGGPAPALYTTTPRGSGLEVLASGDARPALARWAAHQRWIADAGAVLIAHGCPADAPPALVRGSHLAAGYAAGAAQVHATALGIRSRPIGSWQRADLGAALGDAPGRDWIVHALAVAAPSTSAADPAPSPAPARQAGRPAPPPTRPSAPFAPTTPRAPTAPPGEEERP